MDQRNFATRRSIVLFRSIRISPGGCEYEMGTRLAQARGKRRIGSLDWGNYEMDVGNGWSRVTAMLARFVE